jgi:futalosine hydrolase
MKILIVSATRFEVEPLVSALTAVCNVDSNFVSGRFNGIEIDFLITGVGMVATAYFTGKILDESYDLAINAGICGSFNKNLELGDVVNISEDVFSELGAEDDADFLSLEDMQLPGVTKISNRSGALSEVLERLPKVNAITVNTTHGNEASIQKVFDRTHPYVESMEGAAFMFACEQERIPYVQIRAVSNYVEKRNRDTWNIPMAIKNLNEKLIQFISSIE